MDRLTGNAHRTEETFPLRDFLLNLGSTLTAKVNGGERHTYYFFGEKSDGIKFGKLGVQPSGQRFTIIRIDGSRFVRPSDCAVRLAFVKVGPGSGT